MFDVLELLILPLDKVVHLQNSTLHVDTGKRTVCSSIDYYGYNELIPLRILRSN